ncbi:conserved Plasmodium protein, unknown function [Plasmodium ovale]|uniref:SET domain-containing protein n=2 Tax=Plasmodium ovale TaxID=36330 RepID=A0A1D3U964_PLAOA|nr:conserved Plasmodium protein, unknown function [Plasmodium ovale]
MNKLLSMRLICAVLLINLYLPECMKIHKNKINLFPNFVKNYFPKELNNTQGDKNNIVRMYKRVSPRLRKKDNILKRFLKHHVSKENDLLNYLSKSLESMFKKKHEYKNLSKNSNFTINNLAHNLGYNTLCLQNVHFTEQDRKKYAYSKNKIHDFFLENNVEVGESLREQIHAWNSVEQEKEKVDNNTGNENEIEGTCDSSGSHDNDNSGDWVQESENQKAGRDEENIICMTAKRHIKKSEVICSIPISYIINYDHIVNKIENFVRIFSTIYNINYIKYMFKNKMEQQLSELDPFTILMYDMYRRHVKFLSFMKSPNIYLKYWDIRLTLIIAYIYFISKYINILLYAYNFNNTFFILVNNYFAEKYGKIHLSTCISNENDQREGSYTSGSVPYYRNKEKENDNNVFRCVGEMNSILDNNTNNILKNEDCFFFFKNYEYYINYIVNKKDLSHLPLLFPDTSFLLFNNRSIQNIVYFRRQMIHEMVNLYKGSEKDNTNFLFIDKDVINRILFTNNKYYLQIEQYLKSSNIILMDAFKPPFIMEGNPKVELNQLYHFILLCSNKSPLFGKNDTQDGEKCIQNEQSRGKNGRSEEKSADGNKIIRDNPSRSTRSTPLKSACSGPSWDNLQRAISSTIYTPFTFESFDEFFNYDFLMRIYAYVSSHVVKMKGGPTINRTDEEKKEIEAKKKNKNRYNLRDCTLSSNIKIKDTVEKVQEFSAKECSNYNFNEYEKKEKENENKHMCLIPLIDVCNHSNIATNSFIKKVNKDGERNVHIPAQDTKSYLITDTQNHPCDVLLHSSQRDHNPVATDEQKGASKRVEYAHVSGEEADGEGHRVTKSLLERVDTVQLISSEDILEGEEITISYGKLSNDLLLLEYGFVDKKNIKVYFHFDVKIVREIIIQIMGIDKLPLIMLDSLEQVKVDLFKKLNVLPINENVYERFDTNNVESAKMIRKKKEILNDYIRKNKYFNEYNIFTMKERINKFYVEEKLQNFQKKKNYFYIGTDDYILDPILLATIRIIIYDDINHLSKISINELLSWDHYLTPQSEIIVIQVLIKLIDEIIYENFYDINYEEMLKQGKVKYANLKFLQNKFLHANLFNSDKCIDVLHKNNFNIVIYNIMKLKELHKSKLKLVQKCKQMVNLLKG